MKRIGEAYQVEGFLVLVSQKGKRVVINAGGSYLGQEYLDMTERDEKVINAASNFCEFVSGHKAIMKHTGVDPLSLMKNKPKKGGKTRVVIHDGKYDKGNKIAVYYPLTLFPD
jgi:hypothetical protein